MDLSQVSYIQKGSGKDLVFFHGYLASKESFAAQTEYFSSFYRVTAFDFLGFGKSSPLSLPFSVSDYANWTGQLLLALGVHRPHIVAHSFGCRVAVKMAARRAVCAPQTNGAGQGFDEDQSDEEKSCDGDLSFQKSGKGSFEFDKMLLTGPAGIVLPRGAGYKFKVGAYRLVKKFAPEFAEKKFGSAEYRTLSPLMKESYKKIVNEDLREDARKIENEVLLVEGREDKTTTQKEAEIYLSCLRRGRIKNMDGGHFAFAENPLVFNLIAEEFFGHD